MIQKMQDFTNLTWVAVQDLVKTGRISKAILPMGSLEQHGPHLPLSTDTMIAEYVAREVTMRCSNAFLMPALDLGCSGEHLGFPGTISIQPETMANVVVDICASVLKSAIRKMFFINGHGGNRGTIDVALSQVKQSFPEMQVYSFTVMDIAKVRFAEIRRSERRLVGHADEIETSMALLIRPESVDMSKAKREEPELAQPLSFETEDLARVSFGWRAEELTKSGVIGDPTTASRETGSVLLNFVADTISKVINEL